MARQINADGLALIKQWEGLSLKAYMDSARVWTIGYGHTSAAGEMQVHKGLEITDLQAETLLQADLAKFEDRVSKAVTVDLTDNQFAALVSFDYNTGAINKASFVVALNRGDYSAVPAGLMKYVVAGGKRNAGLVHRRAAEVGLWAKGVFVAGKDEAVQTAAPPVVSVQTIKDVVTMDNVAKGAGLASSLGITLGTGPWMYVAIGCLILAVGAVVYSYLKGRK
jgi:lysozyme